jgi:hypothetical protein
MVNYLYIGVIAVVIVLLILGAIDRWDIFGDDRENPDSGTERVKHEARSEADFDVSLLKKHKTLTLPAKVMVVSLGGLVLATGVYAYLTLRNGAPVEVPYAGAMEAGAIAIVGIGGGVAYRAKKDRARGRVDIIYEDEDSTAAETETVWFDPSETTRNKDGRAIVKEHFPTRILGLFGRRKLVAHDRELRSERAILSDVVAHEIPDHATKLDEHHYEIHTQDRVVTNGISNAADYRYRSPIELPYQTHLQQRERINKMEMKLETKDSILGAAQTELQDLQRRLESQELQSREEAIDQVTEIMQLMPARNENVEIKNDRSPRRLPRDQREVAENGSEVDA